MYLINGYFLAFFLVAAIHFLISRIIALSYVKMIPTAMIRQEEGTR